MITPEEKYFLYPIIGITLIILLRNVTSKDIFKLWSPLTFIALIYMYYTVIGPYLAIQNEDHYIRMVDHRPFFINAWKASLYSLVAIIIGFNMLKVRKAEEILIVNVDYGKLGKRLFYFGVFGVFIAFGVSGIVGVNFLSGEQLENQTFAGSFRNYFLFAMNLFIPAAAFLLISFLKDKKNNLWLIGVSTYAVALYTTLGFRYRIVLLVLVLLITWSFFLKRKPNFLLLIGLGVLLIMAMGIIGMTRSYFGGLKNIENIEGKSNMDLFLSGFSETQTFQTTGLLIDEVPKNEPYLHFQFLLETVSMPVPRQLWPSKPSGESLQTIFAIYENVTTYSDAGTGAAILNFGENYLAFGWWGVIIGGLIFGYVMKLFWIWFMKRSNDPLAIVLITCFLAMLYVVISRGYLPQVFMNFVFIIGPVYYFLRLRNKNKLATA